MPKKKPVAEEDSSFPKLRKRLDMCLRVFAWNSGDSPRLTRSMGPTWVPPGSCRPQVGPMLFTWTLLSGVVPGLLLLLPLKSAALTYQSYVHIHPSFRWNHAVTSSAVAVFLRMILYKGPSKTVWPLCHSYCNRHCHHVGEIFVAG